MPLKNLPYEIHSRAQQLLTLWGRNALAMAERRVAEARASGQAASVARWQQVRDAVGLALEDQRRSRRPAA